MRTVQAMCYKMLLLLSSLMLLHSQVCLAKLYALYKNNDTIGAVQFTQIRSGGTLSSIAQHYDVGFYELVEANPGIAPLEPKVGTMLIIPSHYILPYIRQKNPLYHGIIINSAEMRLYYFPEHSKTVYTYPVGIGRQSWETPTGLMKITKKIKNPWWYVPKSVREASALEGITLPLKMSPGPENPLGKYVIMLSMPHYLIHGTNTPSGVGRRSSAGCIRMYPEDIEQLFSMVRSNTRVAIINQPYKVGWINNRIYLEAHEPLQETLEQFGKSDLKRLAVAHHIKDHASTNINWAKVTHIGQQHTGIPDQIGYKKQ